MTRGELADVLGLKESYLQAHWQKAVKAQKNRGVELYKIGRGEDANYGVKLPWEYEVAWSVDELEMF